MGCGAWACTSIPASVCWSIDESVTKQLATVVVDTAVAFGLTTPLRPAEPRATIGRRTCTLVLWSWYSLGFPSPQVAITAMPPLACPRRPPACSRPHQPLHRSPLRRPTRRPRPRASTAIPCQQRESTHSLCPHLTAPLRLRSSRRVRCRTSLLCPTGPALSIALAAFLHLHARHHLTSSLCQQPTALRCTCHGPLQPSPGRQQRASRQPSSIRQRRA